MAKLNYKQIFGTPLADVISERTGGAGVTVDGVLLKDSQVSTDVINELTAGFGVTADSVLLKDGFIQLTEQSGDPANPATNNGIVYVKEAAGQEELFFLDSSGNVTQITPGGGGADSDWTIDGSDMFSAVSGSVGVGQSAGADIDEKFHVQDSVDGGDVALLIENTFVASGSLDETVTLKFGFNGFEGPHITAVKRSDYEPTIGSAASDLRISVPVLGVQTTDPAIYIQPVSTVRSVITFNSDSPTTTAHAPAEFKGALGTAGICLRLTASGGGTLMLGTNNAASASQITGSSAGIKFRVAQPFSSSTTVHHDFGLGLYQLKTSTGTVGMFITTGNRGFEWANGVGSTANTTTNASIRHGSGAGGAYPYDGAQGSGHIIIHNQTISGGAGQGDFVVVGGPSINNYFTYFIVDKDGRIGMGPIDRAAIDEKVHVQEEVNGDVAILLENSQAADAGTNETVSLKFGFGGNNGAGLIQIGKVNDWVVAGDRDAFMSFQVADGDSLTEALRLEADGGTKIGFHAASAIAKPTITGSRAGNAALADVLTQLASYGLIVDSTSA